MNRKGELTAAQIIMVVIAILGFVIVLAALYLVNLGGYSDEDICKLSVLTRATAPGGAQAAIPLKCRTQKICLTESFFGGCKEQFPEKENVEYVRLSGSVENKRRIIEETSANAMYDCWNMMGQGKLDLFGSASVSFGAESVTSSCVVCSRVAIDNGVSKDVLFIAGDSDMGSAINLREYMKNNQIPGQSLTYLQAFTDRGVSSYAKTDESALKSEEKGISTTSMVNNEMAFVFMQIKPTTVGNVLTNQLYAGGTIAGAVLLSPAGKIVSFIGTGFVLIGTVVVGTATGTVGAINALEGQKVAGAYCGEFSSSKETKNAGCSIVQGISYRFDAISQLCGKIEGEL